MPETYTIVVGALNLAANPHPAGIYVELLRIAAGVEVNVWGSDFARITAPRKQRNSPLYAGRVLVWARIDREAPWIDKNKEEEATPEDMARVSIPEELEPNYRTFQYVLDPDRHIVALEFQNDRGQSFGPQRALRLFAKLMSQEIVGVTGVDVNVTMLPEENTVERIFSVEGLRKVHIHLVRPNPDDVTDETNAIIRRMLTEQNAKSLDLSLTKAPETEKLQLNDDTRKLANAAASNGYVEAIGRSDAGEKIEESTRLHPKKLRLVVQHGASAFGQLLQSISAFRI